MTKITILNNKGEKGKDLTLNANVWGIEPNDLVLKKALDLQLASLRQGTAKTKTRSEVSGGGRKPWRQKGTGRARQGSIRATQWRGGGIAGGVTPRNYTFKMNKKERVLALKSALTYLIKDKKLVVLDKLDFKDNKTKSMITLLDNLKLDGKVLFVESYDNLNLMLATSNLANTMVVSADDISPYTLINTDYVVMTEETAKAIEEGLK